MEKLALVINEADNVAVALQDIAAGSVLALPDGSELRAATDIPCGHKVALRAFLAGDPVIKYGEAIGRSSRDIARGEPAAGTTGAKGFEGFHRSPLSPL